MRTVDQFIESAAAASKPPESELAYAAQRAQKEFDVEQAKLIRQIRVRDGKVVFADGAKDVQDQVLAAESKMEAVRSDIKVYLDALQEAGSLTALVEQLGRHRRTLANLKHDHEAIIRQLVTKGVERPQDHTDALNSGSKLDRVTAELTPVINDLQDRVNKAKAVIEKH